MQPPPPGGMQPPPPGGMQPPPPGATQPPVPNPLSTPPRSSAWGHTTEMFRYALEGWKGVGV
jgi:hypothetical protein